MYIKNFILPSWWLLFVFCNWTSVWAVKIYFIITPLLGKAPEEVQISIRSCQGHCNSKNISLPEDQSFKASSIIAKSSPMEKRKSTCYNVSLPVYLQFNIKSRECYWSSKKSIWMRLLSKNTLKGNRTTKLSRTAV